MLIKIVPAGKGSGSVMTSLFKPVFPVFATLIFATVAPEVSIETPTSLITVPSGSSIRTWFMFAQTSCCPLSVILLLAIKS